MIANLATAALSISLPGFFFVMSWNVCCGPLLYRWVYPAMAIMCIAALVEATADTVSSEIGQAFGGAPVMLVGLRRVDIGTDGAVTLLGSGAGVIAGVLVAAVGAWALRLSGAIGNWPMTIIMVVAFALLPVPAYVADYRNGIAPPAFGLPERRSKEKRDAWFSDAVSDDAPLGPADPIATLTRAGGTSGA